MRFTRAKDFSKQIVAGDQGIVKLDEDFTRIVTPQFKLSKDSQYRIYEVE